MPRALPCTLAGRCGGCAEHATSLETQRAAKVGRLRALLAAAGILVDAAMTTPAALAFREHLDVRWDGARLGLIGVDGVVDMTSCPLVVGPLNAWLAEVRASPPPIARASLRLRASSRSAARGLWIDCAHSDVKALLASAWLTETAAKCVVELGPKAREVITAPAAKLVEATLRPWSTTFDRERALPLYTGVRAFSQPGAMPNRVLVDAVRAAVAGDVVLELGAGAGNLTLPLLAAGRTVRAVELDTGGLDRSAREAKLAAKLTTHAVSFERAADLAPLIQGVDTIVADPPRQGLGRFLDGLAGLSKGLRPPEVVYLSCHPEALARDAERLTTLGYRLTSLRGIDQFPWTPHAEWLATFSR